MSTPKPDVSRLAAQALAKKNDSTHGPGPEASAAQLIRCLRKSYPLVATKSVELLGTDGLTPSELSAAASAYVLALGSLIGHLNNLMDNAPVEFATVVLANSTIAPTLEVIRLISELDTSRWPFEDKQRIFKQMRSIAMTHPGLSWDPNHERWSTNHRYNPETKTIEMVMASPAETLNLLCAAILDAQRYQKSPSGDDLDRLFRIESVAVFFLMLEQQNEEKQYQICSAGRQHGMLFLLDGVYCQKPRDESGEPYLLIGDTNAFLLKSLSGYIEEQLRTLEPSRRVPLVLKWIRWQAGLEPDDDSPILTWLNENSAGDWKSDCKEYLSHRCGTFGLNPELCNIDETLASIPYLRVMSRAETLASSILNQPLLPVHQRPVAAAGGAGGDEAHDFLLLISRSNEALAAMKAAMNNPLFIDKESDGINDFYTAFELTKTLCHYSQLTRFLGAEEGDFHDSIHALQRALLHYYRDFTPGKRLLPEFSGPQSRFTTKKDAFNQQSRVDFVENFFASLASADNPQEVWRQLAVVKDPSMKQHPLLVTDETLRSWYNESVTSNDDGSIAAIDITPYQINRILLHAFLAPYKNWSPFYENTLQTLTKWLLEARRPTASGILMAFKEGYPPAVLRNLFLVSQLLKASSFHESMRDRLLPEEQHRLSRDYLLTQVLSKATTEEHLLLWPIVESSIRLLIQNGEPLNRLLSLSAPQQRTLILTAIEDGLVDIIQNREQLSALLSLSEYELNCEQRTWLLTTIGARLRLLIQNSGQLRELFCLSVPQLSREQRTYILTTLELGAMIQNSGELRSLFCLSESQVYPEHREQIWAAIRDRLESLIQNGGQLGELFSLSTAQLNDEQRERIWLTIQGQLATLIQNSGQLRVLLRLSAPQLSPKQREQIWLAVQGRLGSLIQNGEQLKELFLLSASQLSTADRTKILKAIAIQGRLGDMIQNAAQLRELLLLSEPQLNAVHRMRILGAIEDRLDDIIQNHEQLMALLLLSEPELNRAQRTRILTAIGDRLGLLIQNSGQLKELFFLYECRLSREQRTLILTAIGDRLGDIIQSSDELSALFDLTEPSLYPEHRAQIWAAIKGRLGLLIQNGDKLINLLLLSTDRLSLEQRTQILAAIKGRLGNMIQEVSKLRELFWCELSREQRTQILTAIGTRLRLLIQNGEQLRTLFLLTAPHLYPEQRAQIWGAIKGRLGSLIQNGEQLKALFSLSTDQLSLKQRAEILATIKKNRLGLLIQNSEQLIALFSLSTDQLSLKQRAQIWAAIKEDRLGVLIQNGRQLTALLSLTEPQFNRQQRARTLTAIKPQLGLLIQEEWQLRSLLSLNESQLEPDQRTEILSAIKEQLGLLIQDGDRLRTLFTLPIPKLNRKQRTQILTAIKPQLGLLIQDQWQLRSLLSLNESQLYPEHRAKIWDTIEARLVDMIRDVWQLRDFLSLSKSQLYPDQRAKILEAIKDRLGVLIQNGLQLKDLFSLSTDKLGLEQRIQILRALDDRVDELGRQVGMNFRILPPAPTSPDLPEPFEAAASKPREDAIKETLVENLQNFLHQPQTLHKPSCGFFKKSPQLTISEEDRRFAEKLLKNLEGSASAHEIYQQTCTEIGVKPEELNERLRGMIERHVEIELTLPPPLGSKK